MMENPTPAADDKAAAARSTRWISRGFEALLERLGERHAAAEATPEFDFDIVIVGSGYGGALSALKLSRGRDKQTNRTLRICVLERGREYLPGMFPTSEAELPGHIRFNTPEAAQARGRHDALLDLRIGTDITSLVGNGLGGGSLINAGVMLAPREEIFQSTSWPEALRDPQSLAPHFREAKRLLSANGRDLLKFDSAHPDAPLKLRALRKLGREDFQSVPLSIAITQATNIAGVKLRECKRCGDCATGCNHRAKNSLDQNCLALAQHRGVELFTGAQVLRIERGPKQTGWVLHVAHTDIHLREQQGTAFPLTARRVILAAGTYGSTEILMRSRGSTRRFSPQLGARFSGNGDLLVAAYGQNERINAVALETVRFDQRNIGPSVTGMIDRRSMSEQLAIQEFAIPGALRRLFSEFFTLAKTFHSLGECDGGLHRMPADGRDPCGVDPAKIDNTQILGLISKDAAAGTMELIPGSEAGQGAIRVRWPTLARGSEVETFSRQVKVVRDLVKQSKQGGTVLENPIWRLLPDNLQSFVDIPRGPALTVHPLGGCAMGDDWARGVVDHIGRVFDLDAPEERHDDLVVLDGSIIPTALGINPSLTIAAITLRALEHLRDLWSITAVPDDSRRTDSPPVFAEPTVAKDEPAEVAILERLAGELDLELDHQTRKYRVELTLEFTPAQLRELASRMDRTLTIDSSRSYLRIFDPQRWLQLYRTGASEGQFDQCAEFKAGIAGQLHLLRRQPSWAPLQIARAVHAWFLNRGSRDLWQRYINKPEAAKRTKRGSRWQALLTFLQVANHAGAVRLFDYELTIENRDDTPGAQSRAPYAQRLLGKNIRGRKTLAYRVGSNPWAQLSEVELRGFPGAAWRKPPKLELDAKFYAQENLHLMRLSRQRDHATGLFEIASFVLTVARVIISTHFWSFRKPDAPEARVPNRLPEGIPGLPLPNIVKLPVARTKDGESVHVRLTRYKRTTASAKPVLMIHGFSASGTSFTHSSLKPSLAEYLWRAGRDVWVVDLRTSSGLDSCRHQWKFEDIAREDIPTALEYMFKQTGRRADVIAHCMGGAMFSMALLDSRTGARVRERIDSVILSQVGPTIVFRPANVFRAYAVRYIEHAIGDVNFEMRPADGLGSNLMDRMLATVKYDPADFRLENPRTPWKRTPFVGTRHRMDAWFGCVFKLSNVDRAVLDHIDDLFGDINLHTTFQTIHFARQGIITTRDGRNEFLRRRNLGHWRGVPTLSIHGSLNELADIATLTRMHKLMRSINPDYHSFTAEGFGHQDCIIGREAGDKIFPEMLQFLDAPATYRSPTRQPPLDECGDSSEDSRLAVCTPWLGPLLAASFDDPVIVGADPKLGDPAWIIIVPVMLDSSGNRYQVKQNAYLSVQAPAPVTIHQGRHDEDMNKAMLDGIAMYSVAIAAQARQLDDLLVLMVYDEHHKESPPAEKMLQAAVARYLHDTLADELEPALLERLDLPPAAEPLRFAMASCQYPAGPLDPSLAASSYDRLDALLKGSGTRPQFLILTGDQVYTDATAGLMDVSKADDAYQRPYEEFLRTRAVRSVFRRVPVFAMLDDHEIRDNWHEGMSNVPSGKAKTAYLKFQRAGGPACMPPRGTSRDPMWYTTSRQGIGFFFTDTRTERSSRRAQDIQSAQIMSEGQMAALKEWLSAQRSRNSALQFVVSPSILLPRRLSTATGVLKISHSCALQSDAWDGYPRSLLELLAHIVEQQVPNVIFLSGDEHHSCSATAKLWQLERERPVADTATIIHSIHSSGLYSPYAFANGRREDLACFDRFDFTMNGRSYRCEVTLNIDSPRDGFAVVECHQNAAQPAVYYTFHKASDQQDGLKRHRLLLKPLAPSYGQCTTSPRITQLSGRLY
jgi:cholesterol oxidase